MATESSDTTPDLPDLANLIPLEATLHGRFARMKQKVGGLVDLADVEHRLDAVDIAIKTYISQFHRLQTAISSGYFRFTALKTAIHSERQSLAQISASLTEVLRQLGGWRTTWLAEKQQWTTWQSSGHDVLLDDVKSTFTTAHRTIDTALALLLQQIKPLFVTQQHIRDLQVRLEVLATDVDVLIASMGDEVLHADTAPILSSRYMAQFDSWLWYDVRNGLRDVAWPDARFIAHNRWIMLIHGVFSLVVLLVVVRHRRHLAQLADWRFVATRPISTGCFVGGMAAFMFYEWSFLTFNVIYGVLVAIPFARLLGALLGAGWKKQLVYALVTLLLTTRLLEALNLPRPLFRLYILLAVLASLLGFLRWAAHSERDADFWLYRWALWLGAGLFGVILLGELSGEAQLAEYFLGASIRSLIVVLAFGLLRYLMCKGLEGAIQRTPTQSLALPTAKRYGRRRAASDVVGGCSHWGSRCCRSVVGLESV